ncbi:hypothetical protein LZ31DRAFT_88236 [Colletotrichum somersetense]|nr:hypothetical protein LZ31DRAFT_88236 [Colletotrichum somersetense]
MICSVHTSASISKHRITSVSPCGVDAAAQHPHSPAYLLPPLCFSLVSSVIQCLWPCFLVSPTGTAYSSFVTVALLSYPAHPSFVVIPTIPAFQTCLMLPECWLPQPSTLRGQGGGAESGFFLRTVLSAAHTRAIPFKGHASPVSRLAKQPVRQQIAQTSVMINRKVGIPANNRRRLDCVGCFEQTVHPKHGRSPSFSPPSLSHTHTLSLSCGPLQNQQAWSLGRARVWVTNAVCPVETFHSLSSQPQHARSSRSQSRLSGLAPSLLQPRTTLTIQATACLSLLEVGISAVGKSLLQIHP